MSESLEGFEALIRAMKSIQENNKFPRFENAKPVHATRPGLRYVSILSMVANRSVATTRSFPVKGHLNKGQY